MANTFLHKILQVLLSYNLVEVWDSGTLPQIVIFLKNNRKSFKKLLTTILFT